MLHSNTNLIYDLKVIILDCMKLDAFVAYACSFGNNLLVFNAFVKKNCAFHCTGCKMYCGELTKEKILYKYKH